MQVRNRVLSTVCAGLNFTHRHRLHFADGLFFAPDLPSLLPVSYPETVFNISEKTLPVPQKMLPVL